MGGGGGGGESVEELRAWEGTKIFLRWCVFVQVEDKVCFGRLERGIWPPVKAAFEVKDAGEDPRSPCIAQQRYYEKNCVGKDDDAGKLLSVCETQPFRCVVWSGLNCRVSI